MGSLLVALLMAPSAIAQEKWRTGLRIIPWVADGHVKADFTGDRYQTSVVVLLTATGAVFDAEDPTCTVQAEGVELIGPSGLRASTHTFQFDSEADPETPEATPFRSKVTRLRGRRYRSLFDLAPPGPIRILK